jgi:glucose-1-phosphate cytidylyltransferase
MKVVLFCGGFGTRLREHSETIPKPMVPIGARPILWYLMKYYAHFGHRQFILCLGYRGDVIKQYFLNYDECMYNDFVMVKGGRDVRLYHRDIDDWEITFAETGQHSNIAERLKAVEPYLDGEEMFLANYTDVLSDLDLGAYIERFQRRDAVASFLSVRPNQSFHLVSFTPEGQLRDIQGVTEAGIWINGGFFVFRREIFDHIAPGEELVVEPFKRLIAQDALMTERHHGFWNCMDTLKDKQMFDDMVTRGHTPWAMWERPRAGGIPSPDVHRQAPDSPAHRGGTTGSASSAKTLRA